MVAEIRSESTTPTSTLEAWEQVQSSPPNRTGVEKIFKIAREHGWVRKGEPTYPADSVHSNADKETARSKMQRIADEFLNGVASGFPIDPWKQVYLRGEDPPPPIWAVWVDTGIGKTRITIETLARWLRGEGIGKTVIYTVPRHRLGERIDEQFAALGINARQFYGRNHIDPEKEDPDKPEDEQVLMCLRPEAVELAMQCQADITKACCKNGKQVCPLKVRCGYYRQQDDAEGVQVWIVASDMLFHTQKVLGKPALVIIDEAIWQKGIRGIEREKGEETVALDSIARQKPENISFAMDAETERAYLRYQLVRKLQQQDDEWRRRVSASRPPRHLGALRSRHQP